MGVFILPLQLAMCLFGTDGTPKQNPEPAPPGIARIGLGVPG